MARYSVADRVRRRLRRHVAEPFDREVRARARRWRNAGRDYRPVFVCGASGGGTSLLALSLGQAFDCAGVLYESTMQVPESSVLHIPHLNTFGSVAEYARSIAPTAAWSVESAREDLLHCYRSYTSGPSDVVIDKGPDANLLRVAFLARCFPRGAFVGIFRDPTANVEGFRRKWKVFREDALEASIRFYAQLFEAFLREAEAMPERAVLVEYERLVEAPEATLAAVGARLRLEPARQRRRLWTSPNVEGMGIRNVQNSEIGYVRDANERARARLAPAELAALDAALGPLRERLRRSPLALGG
jgi:acetyl esterase/lipase